MDYQEVACLTNIRWLNEVGKTDGAMVGGKGANLGEMFRAGFPVPRAFVITTSAYREQVSFSKIAEKLAAPSTTESDAEGDMAGRTIKQFLEAPFVPHLEAEIRQAYRSLGNSGWVAVRSSATSEDLADASFAGQQETFLGIHGERDLLSAVRKCWASLWSPRAVHYRNERGYDHQSAALAVVVQEMVESDASGVMFTVNPINGNAREMMISAAYGLGEAVVSGLVTPDSYTIMKYPLRIRHQQINRKELMVVQGDQGSEAQPVAVEKQAIPALSRNKILEIAAMGMRIENHYGGSRDIEWAVANGKVYLLQSRPITTLKDNEREPKSPHDNDVYGWVHLGRIPKLARSKVLPSLLDHMPMPLRPFDIATSLSAALEGAGRVAADLGITMPKNIIQNDSTGLILFSPPVPSISQVLLRSPWAWRQLKRWARYDPLSEWKSVDGPALYDMLRAIRVLADNEKELLNAIQQARTVIAEDHYRRFRKYMAAGFAANRKLNRLLGKVVSPEEAQEVKQKLLRGLDYKTATINREIFQLARLALRNPTTKDIISDTPFGHIYGALCQDTRCSEFVTALGGFLRRNGCRTTVMEPQPSYPTWRDEPDQVLCIVAALLRRPDELSHDEKAIDQEFSRIRADIIRRFDKFPKLQRQFNAAIEGYRGYTVAREGTLYFFEECVALIRDLTEKLGALLVEKGALDEKQDVYYLMPSELEQLLTGDNRVDYSILSKKRRSAWEEMSASWGKNTLAPTDTKDVLKGAGASPGTVTGVVRTIDGPHEFHKLRPGDILVCPSTSPSWTPLFSVAAGVVAETGSILSHAAIVAREYGIPAVMACENATQLLADGDRVTIDGTKGLVYRVW